MHVLEPCLGKCSVCCHVLLHATPVSTSTVSICEAHMLGPFSHQINKNLTLTANAQQQSHVRSAERISSKHAIISPLNMEHMPFCRPAESRNHTMSRQNGVNDVRTAWIAQMAVDHEALLHASDTGELEVNPLFFTPPSKTKHQGVRPEAPLTTVVQNDNAKLACSPAPRQKTLQSFTTLCVEQTDNSEMHHTRNLNYVSDPKTRTSSDFPTWFRKPINWDEEELLLEEQDTAIVSALPELVDYSNSCSETDRTHSVSPASSCHTEIYINDELQTGLVDEGDWQEAELEVATVDVHDLPKADQRHARSATTTTPELLHLELNLPREFKLESETTSLAGLPSGSPSKRKSTHTSSWPAKKACPTTEVFTQDVISLQFTKTQPAKKILEQVAESREPPRERER
nr:hypothetical protein CFP56_16676 [Quercus suber]